MKQLTYFVLCIFLFSCSIKKNEISRKKSTGSIDNLTAIERSVVNEFLESELASDRYKFYQNYKYVIVKESSPKMKTIESYLYLKKESHEERDFAFKIEGEKKLFFLDSLKIKKIKSELENEIIYQWKVSDFKNNIKINIISDKKIKEMTNTGEYLDFSDRLIIYLSKPLLIDSEKALISFSVSKMPFNPISHFCVLMIKKNNKWVQSVIYDDGIYY